MTITPQASLADDDMPAKIDFSRGTRGAFFNPGAQLQLTAYLEAQPIEESRIESAQDSGDEPPAIEGPR